MASQTRTGSSQALAPLAVAEGLSPPSKHERKAPEGFASAIVRRIDKPTPDLALLRLHVDGAFPFEAGQFTLVHGQSKDGPRRRAYSIASPPSWLPRLDLAVSNVNPDGLSGWLCARQPGDRLLLEPAKGKFTFRSQGRLAAFLATGTGVAPFRAMLHDQWAQGNDPHAILFLGSRSRGELPYHEEFMGLAKEHANFEYIPVVSRPAPTWAGLTGRIQAPFLARFEAKSDYHSYLCGSTAMIQDAATLLNLRGIPRDHVFQERYG